MLSKTPAFVYLWFSALLFTTCPGLPGRAVAQEVPFTGVVIQNQTDVRAGAADRYYRVGELNKGRLVQVDEVIAGWNKIVPPEGFHSYISKAFVDAKGDGSTGVVNSDRSKVYAADVNGPAGSYRVQAILNSGDGVQIVAEEGSHYKIVAPTNAYVYLPPGSVRRAMAMEIAPTEPAEPEPAKAQPVEQPKPAETKPEPKPEPKPEVKPEPVVVAPVEIKPAPEPLAETTAEPVITELNPPLPAEPELVEENSSEKALDTMLGGQAKATDMAPPAIGASLADLEKHFKATKALPVEEKPLTGLIAGYEALQTGGELSPANAVLVKNRLIVLRHEQNIAEGLAAIAKANEPAPEPKPVDPGPVTYDAVGRLLASSVYDGKTLPRMYRLTDPATGRAVAYIRADGPGANIGHLGRLVGVQGKAAYDPDLKLKVITVKRIDILEAAN